MESTAENPCHGDEHIQSDYVSPIANQALQVQPFARYVAWPPPVTHNHRPHGVRLEKQNIVTFYYSHKLFFALNLDMMLIVILNVEHTGSSNEYKAFHNCSLQFRKSN